MILQVELLLSDEQVANDTGMQLQGRPSLISGSIVRELANALAEEMMKRDGTVKLNWETRFNFLANHNVTHVRASVVIGHEIEYAAPTPTHQSTWIP